MDTSKQYIKMCESAKEIHNHEASTGDWYADNCRGLHILSIHDFLPSKEITHSELCEKEYIWLPRQDQLQEMLSKPEIMKFMREFNDEQFLTWTQEWTFEQLWLAFVMKEKFNKIWNGEDEWIDDSS